MSVQDDLATLREDSALLADWAEEPTAISNVDADNCRARIIAAIENLEVTLRDKDAEITRLRADWDALRHALAEPCAECGHIDWRADWDDSQ